MPIRVFLLAWLAGGLALLALVGLWVVLVELTGVGGNPTLAAAEHFPTALGFEPSKIRFYLTVGVVFGTIAFLTQSVLPAIPVHIAGDLLFFLVIWPNDSGRRHVLSGGPDAAFWLSLLELFIFGSLTALIFVWLARVRDNPAAYATQLGSN